MAFALLRFPLSAPNLGHSGILNYVEGQVQVHGERLSPRSVGSTSVDSGHTRLALLRGEAMLEVNELFKQNNLQVTDSGATTAILKKGLYAFNTAPAKVAVYDGEAAVVDGDSHKTIKKGHEALLTNSVVQSTKLDRNAHDDLYNWSDLRSEYLSEASVQSAGTYIVNTGGWFGAGWYWNPLVLHVFIHSWR